VKSLVVKTLLDLPSEGVPSGILVATSDPALHNIIKTEVAAQLSGALRRVDEKIQLTLDHARAANIQTQVVKSD
jgi:hypothetical protein